MEKHFQYVAQKVMHDNNSDFFAAHFAKNVTQNPNSQQCHKIISIPRIPRSTNTVPHRHRDINLGQTYTVFSCINTTSIYRSYKCIINPRICKPPIHIFSVSTQVLSPNSFSTINIACTQTTWQQVYLNGVMVKWCNGEMSHTW